jgi:hypothetical protein
LARLGLILGWNRGTQAGMIDEGKVDDVATAFGWPVSPIDITAQFEVIDDGFEQICRCTKAEV